MSDDTTDNAATADDARISRETVNEEDTSKNEQCIRYSGWSTAATTQYTKQSSSIG